MKCPKQHGVANDSVWRELYVTVAMTIAIVICEQLGLNGDLIGCNWESNKPIKTQFRNVWRNFNNGGRIEALWKL